MAPKVKIFLSYARSDDEPFVKKLYEDLTDEGFDVWWDRVSMPNRGLTFLQEIQGAIDQRDRLLLVAGPVAFNSDYVNYEWQYAYEEYKGINIALRLGDHPKVEENLPKQLRNFDIQDFRDDAKYGERLATLKRQLMKSIAPIGTLHNVPELPRPFLKQADPLDALREFIISDVDMPTIISAEQRTTTVEGMGGIGKSVLATAFANDRKVRFAFPDGIIWLTIGRNPNKYVLYRNIGQAIGDNLDNYLDENLARQRIQIILRNKKCLLILDDLWKVEIGRDFSNLISGTEVRLLITTRNLQINIGLNANEYRLNLLSETQAIDYLRSWVGDDPDLAHIAEKLDYLFLALKIAGARMKKDRLSGKEYLQKFDRISRMFDFEDSLKVSIEDSINTVFANAQDDKLLFHAWGIFHEDASIPQQTILQLWAYLRPGVDEFNLGETLNTLVDLALVEQHEDKTYTLHDLLHSYCREELSDQYVQTHQDLLTTYRKAQNSGGWHTIIDDGYFYDHLTYHLEQSDQTPEIYKLFDTPDWTNVRSTLGVIQDFDHGRGVFNLQTTDLASHLRFNVFSQVLDQRFSDFPIEALPTALQRGWISIETLMIALRSMQGDAMSKIKFYIENRKNLSQIAQERYAREILDIALDIRQWTDDEEISKAKILFELQKGFSDEFQKTAKRVIWNLIFEIELEQDRNRLFDLIIPLDNDPIANRQQLELLGRDFYDFVIKEQVHWPFSQIDVKLTFLKLSVINKIASNYSKEQQSQLWNYVAEDFDNILQEGSFDLEYARLFAKHFPKLPKIHQERLQEIIWPILDFPQRWEWKEIEDILGPLVPYISSSDLSSSWKRAKQELKYDQDWGEECMITIALYYPAEKIPSNFSFKLGSFANPRPEVKASIDIALAYRLSTNEAVEQYTKAWQILVHGNFVGSIEMNYLEYTLCKISEQIIPNIWLSMLNAKPASDMDRYDARNFVEKNLKALTLIAKYMPIDYIEKALQQFINEIHELIARYIHWEYREILFHCLYTQYSVLHNHSQTIEMIKNLVQTLLSRGTKNDINLVSIILQNINFEVSIEISLWNLLVNSAQNLTNVHSKRWALTRQIEYLPDSIRKQIWIETWKEILTQRDDEYLTINLAEKIQFVQESLSELEKEFISQSTHFPIWDWVFNKDFYDRFCIINNKGLAYLASLGCQTFADQLWKSRIEKNAILLAGVMPNLSSLNYHEALSSLLRISCSEIEETEDLRYFISLWSEELRWNIFSYLVSADEQITSYHMAENRSQWAIILASQIPNEDIIEAWHVSWNFHVLGSDEEALLAPIAAQLPQNYLINAWEEIAEVEGNTRYFDKTKSIIVSRFTDRQLLKVFQKRNIKIDFEEIMREIIKERKNLANIKNILLPKQIYDIQKDALGWWREKIMYFD